MLQKFHSYGDAEKALVTMVTTFDLYPDYVTAEGELLSYSKSLCQLLIKILYLFLLIHVTRNVLYWFNKIDG